MRGRSAHGSKVRYEYDKWLDEDGRLYVRVEAIEWEWATDDSFQLGARRQAVRWFEREGLVAPRGTSERPFIEVWDVALDYAIDMPVAKVFRTVQPVPARQTAAA